MADFDDENFVSFGEALEPLDEDNLPRKKPITAEDQFAVDDQGRRRFHGAFTGGFSAGYFNSVGTRDGWRPQQFKSSRSSKSEGVSQRPEDFMDEEDTGEFGIAPTGIRATSDFADHSGASRKRKRIHDNDGPIPGAPVLTELLKPASDTIGVTLLRKMGWKPGQGVGPRLTKTEKKLTRKNRTEKKIYGCAMPGHELNLAQSESSDDEDEGILFAPDDYEPFRCNPKDNYFGIGYSGLDRRPVLSTHINLFDEPAFKMNDKNKKLSIRGQAFGVGAFEADDEDIYARDDMSRYDFALGPEKKKKSRWSSKENSQSLHGKCLEGFTPAKNPLDRKKSFNPPDLPKDFKPVHLARKSRFTPVVESADNQENTRPRGLARHELNAESRAAILGESMSISPQANEQITQCAAVKTSVAANIISRTLNLQGKDQVEERAQLENQRIKFTASWMDKLSSKSFVSAGVEGSSTSSANLEEFKLPGETPSIHMTKPFMMDEEKQKRFEKFLEFSAAKNAKEKLASVQPLSMTEWQRERECEEFEQAARLFERSKPLNSVDNKFVSATSDYSTLKPQDSAEDAAKMKMFGKLTRTIDTWQPASIVCKRFNVPEPLSGCAQPEKAKKYAVFDSLDFCTGDSKFEKATDTAESYKQPHIAYNPPELKHSIPEKTMSLCRTLDTSDIDTSSTRSSDKLRSFEASYEKVFGKDACSVGQSTGETSKGRSNESAAVETSEFSASVVEEKDKAEEKKDLFKAIFLSSSSESESENEAEEGVDSDRVKLLLIGKPANELNVQRNTSPARGIFAQLDLEDLVSKPGASTLKDSLKDTEINKPQSEVSDEQKVDVKQSADVATDLITPNVYGPALPNKLGCNSTNYGLNSSPDSSRKTVFKSVVVAKLKDSEVALKWVERSSAKKSKREKKKHKEKEKERKHKHKSKKKKH